MKIAKTSPIAQNPEFELMPAMFVIMDYAAASARKDRRSIANEATCAMVSVYLSTTLTQSSTIPISSGNKNIIKRGDEQNRHLVLLFYKPIAFLFCLSIIALWDLKSYIETEVLI